MRYLTTASLFGVLCLAACGDFDDGNYDFRFGDNLSRCHSDEGWTQESFVNALYGTWETREAECSRFNSDEGADSTFSAPIMKVEFMSSTRMAVTLEDSVRMTQRFDVGVSTIDDGDDGIFVILPEANRDLFNGYAKLCEDRLRISNRKSGCYSLTFYRQ